MKAGPKAYALIEQFESCAVRRQDGKYRAYPDPATGGAPWTIGWGTTGPGIGPRTVWTRAQCDEALREHVAGLETRLSDALVRVPTTQNQLDALIDFAYNEGIGALVKSTLFMYHKAGNFDAASAQFVHWDMAGRGQHMSGLARRRRAEAALYRETPHAR